MHKVLTGMNLQLANVITGPEPGCRFCGPSWMANAIRASNVESIPTYKVAAPGPVPRSSPVHALMFRPHSSKYLAPSHLNSMAVLGR
jgi:hypothetical protein